MKFIEGEILKNIRNTHKLTQQDVANIVNLGLKFISYCETDPKYRAKTTLVINKLLNTDIEDYKNNIKFPKENNTDHNEAICQDAIHKKLSEIVTINRSILDVLQQFTDDLK